MPHLAYQTTDADAALVARLKAQGVRVVVVFLSGRPMFTGKLINQADAFVAAWLPGTQGRGVADVLVAGPSGKAARDFTGRLPFAWPADARSPVTEPLLPAGYGLSYAKPARLAAVSEDPRVDLAAQARMQATTYIVRGKVPAPWHLEIDGAISTRAVDLSAQEDARQFTWNAASKFAVNGPVVDLSRQLADGSSLLIDWRIDKPANGPVLVSFGEATFDLRAEANSKPAGTVLKTLVPLRCFRSAGTKIARVGSPLRIEAPKGFVATIRNVRIEGGGGNGPCPVQTK